MEAAEHFHELTLGVDLLKGGRGGAPDVLPVATASPPLGTAVTAKGLTGHMGAGIIGI
ncbi:MAG: hypothetical protein ABWK05_05165 [Pyrobaculum sp.]